MVTALKVEGTPRGARRAVVEQQLCALIDELDSGAAPTERALAERWGVARMTVREAIASLTRGPVACHPW